MKPELLHNLIAVTRGRGEQKKDQGLGFLIPTTTDNLGTVKFLSKSVQEMSDLVPGDVVYFGNKHDPISIDGAPMLVMEYSNILAVERNEKT